MTEVDKTKLVPEVAEQLLKMARDLHSLADSVQAVCALVTDSPPEKKAETAAEIPLEKVRAVLADKSREGHTAEVRAIIRKYGADRLSDIDPKDFPAVLAEAEVL